MVNRTYEPKNSTYVMTVSVQEEQAKALDALYKRDDFKAAFWAEKVDWLNNGDVTETGNRVVRVNGVHMVIADELDKGVFRGCGGAEYGFEFSTGEVILSTNVWHQGEVPHELKDILVDNARIMKWDEVQDYKFLHTQEVR